MPQNFNPPVDGLFNRNVWILRTLHFCTDVGLHCTVLGDVMLRQVIYWKAVFINEVKPTLNSRAEWGNTKTLREWWSGFKHVDFYEFRFFEQCKNATLIRYKHCCWRGCWTIVKVLRDNMRCISVFKLMVFNKTVWCCQNIC